MSRPSRVFSFCLSIPPPTPKNNPSRGHVSPAAGEERSQRPDRGADGCCSVCSALDLLLPMRTDPVPPSPAPMWTCPTLSPSLQLHVQTFPRDERDPLAQRGRAGVAEWVRRPDSHCKHSNVVCPLRCKLGGTAGTAITQLPFVKLVK